MHPSFLFFLGLAGAGKTTMACLYAFWLARQGKRVLLVTTDPLPCLAELLDQEIGGQITAVRDMRNLWALTVNPEETRQAYTQRGGSAVRTLFPGNVGEAVEAELRELCAAEVAAFATFSDLLETSGRGQPALDRVVFDHAPTGEVLQRLQVFAPSTLDKGPQSAGAPGSADDGTVLLAFQRSYQRALRTLRSFARTQYLFVLRPDMPSILYTGCTMDALHALGIHNTSLIVNGVDPDACVPIPNHAGPGAVQLQRLAQIQAAFHHPRHQVLLQSGALQGCARLRAVAEEIFDGRKDAKGASQQAAQAVE